MCNFKNIKEERKLTDKEKKKHTLRCELSLFLLPRLLNPAPSFWCVVILVEGEEEHLFKYILSTFSFSNPFTQCIWEDWASGFLIPCYSWGIWGKWTWSCTVLLRTWSHFVWLKLLVFSLGMLTSQLLGPWSFSLLPFNVAIGGQF